MRRRKFFFSRLSLKRYIIECSNRTGTTFYFISKRRPSVYVSTFFFFSFVSRCVSFHRGFFLFMSPRRICGWFASIDTFNLFSFYTTLS